MVKRFVDDVQFRPTDPTTGAAQTQATLSARLGEFATLSRQFAQREGVKRGAEEAAQVQLERDSQGRLIQPKERDLTFADRFLTGGKETEAYNKTIRDGYLSGLENDIRTNVARIQEQNKSDLTMFNEQVQGYAKGVLSGIEGPAQPAVAQFLERQITSSRVTVQTNTLRKAEAEAQAETITAIEQAGMQAATEARQGKPVASANALQDAFANIDALVETGKLSADQGARQKREIEREATEQTFRHSLDQTFEAEGSQAAFTKLDEMSQKVPKGWTPDEWDSFVASAQTDLRRKQSRVQALANETSQDAAKALRDFEMATATGFEVSDKETSRVASLVQGNSELEKRFQISQGAGAFAVQSRQERNAELETLKTGSLDDVAEFVARSKSNATINRLAQEDGYTLGVQQGLIESIPFSIDDPASFEDKLNQSQILSQHYGVPVSPLTDSEAQQLTVSLPGLTVAEKVTLATTLNASPDVWGHIDQKGGGSFAIAGATGDRAVMYNVFNGQDLIDKKLAQPIKATDYLSDFNEYIEGIYGSEDAKNILQASVAYYASATDNRDGAYDSSSFKDALDAITGGTGNVNGFRVQLPRGYSEDDLEDFIDDMQPETVRALGGVQGVSDDRAVELIRQAGIQSVKDGVYIVTLDNGSLFSESDPTKPFFIEWSDDIFQTNKALASGKARVRKQEAQLKVRGRR